MTLKIYLKNDFKIGPESTPYLKPENSPGPLTEHSTGTLVVLLDYLAASLYFTWVNPTNRKFEERALYRAAELDETGRYAYKATIFPIMTVGLARQDSAFSMVNFREGEKLSPYIKIPVDRSIYPEQTEIPPTAVDDINAEINGVKQNVHEIEIYLPELENMVQGSIENVTYTPENGYLTFHKVNGTNFHLDLPLELIVDSGYYDRENQQLVLILANGDEINIPVGDILIGIASQGYVNDQITERQAIVKVERPPFDEAGLITFMEKLENGIYKVKTQLWGDELLFVSDMFLPDKEIVWGEDEEPTLVLYKEYARYTSNGSSFKWNGDVEEWEMSAGGGAGGGGGSGVFKLTSLSPLTSVIAVGDELKVSVRFQHSLVQFGTMRVLRGSGVIETRGVQTGDILVDLTNHVRAGSNTFTIEISDGETIRTISYNVTGVAVNLTSTFNDIQSYGSTVTIPYRVETAAERKVYFTVDGVTETITEVQLNNIKTLIGLTHGVKEVSIQAAALINGIEILSNTLRFNLIIAINDTPPLISSKFDITTASRGSLVSVDYIIYNPLLEFNEVLLKVDGVLVGQTTAGRTRQFWNLRNLEEGVRVLRIESAGVFLEKTITITPLEINFDNVQDDFLKLYLNSSGRTNSDANKTQWVNLYGPALTANLVGFNFASNGWINDSLVLNGNSKVVVPYKPFQTPVQAVGRTIEIEFETTVGLTDEFIKCMHNDRGFIVYKDRAFLRSSNTSSEVFFQENEKIKLSFVISPVDGTTKVYVNGVMTGIDRMNIETNFQQSVAQDIIINEKYVDGKVFNIRVYERALDHQEILQNYLYDLVSIEDKIGEYTFSDVYDANGMPDIEKVKSKMPVMVIRTYSSDEFGNRLPQTENFRPYVTATYEHNSDPSKNFALPNVRIRTQGTSTLQYPVKNYRLYQGDLETTPVLLNDEMHPAVRLNLKADYMESSMATDPALALLFNTMHTKPIPPKAVDGVSRTTIWSEGAVALFHDDGLSLRFEGVYNLNGDKGDNKQWGFYPELPFPESDMRRFEILFNAANHAVSFVKNPLLSEQEWMTQLYEGFEPRYPYDSEGDEIYTPEQYAQLKDFIEFISDADLETSEGIASFKAEFEQRAELEYFTKYLLSIFIFGLIDNFGKDLLLNTWGNEGGLYPKWYVTLYDMDSGVGIDNQGFMTDSEGNLLFDYNIEMEDEGVFAQASSKLWDAIVIAYPETLKSTYANLRSTVYTWNNIWKYIYTDQIATISKAMYNANAIAKYIEIPGSASWLWMLNGDRINQMRRWLTNRLAYLDSKYDYNTDEKSITARFDIADTNGFNVQVKTSLHQWVTAQLGNSTAGYMKTRTQLGEVATLNHAYTNGTELPFVEFELFNGQYITELVNMKNLPVRTLQVDQAESLNVLDLSKLFPSTQLQSVSFGNNKELLEINLRNNTGLSGLIDLSQATKLRKIDIRDTALTSALLPEGGILTELRLPSTITSLRLVNQTYLTDNFFEIQGTPEFDSLRIENTPNIDSIDLIQYLSPTGAVRITNIELVTKKTSFLDSLVNMLEGRQGIDSFGNIIPNPVLTGTITIYAGSDFDKDYYQSKLPNIIFNHIVLTEGLTYTPSGNNLVISGYSGITHTINIPESVPFGIDNVNYVLGAAVDIRPVIGIVGTNVINSSILNIFIPSTVTTINNTAISSGFEGRITTSLSSKPLTWDITYENILFDEQPFFEEDYFFIRIYDDNTKIELLPMIKDNEELVVIPRAFNDLTITEIPANVLRGSIYSIYIPNTILTINQNLGLINFVLTEHLESSDIVSGPNVLYEIEDSVETYTVTFFRNNNTTDIFVRTWYIFLGIENIAGGYTYLIDGEPIEIPFQGSGDVSIEVYEPVDFRTIVWTGSAYELTQVIVDVEEPDGSYTLIVPDVWNDGVNGEAPCNPSSDLFTEINFPGYSRNKIKEIYYYSNVAGTGTTVIPGFSNSSDYYNQVNQGFLGNNNFPYREKLALYTKKTVPNGMRDGDMTEVHFVNGFKTNAFYGNGINAGLAENKIKNVDSILVDALAGTDNYSLSYAAGTFKWNRIETLEIPYGYNSIASNMFANNLLTSVIIPDGVTTMASSAFENNLLTSLIIPESVANIGHYAFRNNPITSIISYAITPPTVSSSFSNPENITCYVPSGSGAAYEAASGWSSMTIVEMT